MELHEIPYKDGTILYRPLRHLAFIGNQALADYVRRRSAGDSLPHIAEIEEYLESLGFWEPDRDPDGLPDVVDVRPTEAVLLMTNQCNLRCVYCYADAGVRPVESIDTTTCRRVIDAACANAAAQGREDFGVTFHGGGEPTVHFDVMRAAVAHGQGGRLPCRVSMSTNGVWNDRVREFVCANFDSISLSLDGVAAVQDSQRPRADGAGSFDAVMESVAALEEAEISYGVRMTVLPGRHEHVPESVAFLCERTQAQSIQIEPTFTTSRGEYGDFGQEFGDAFVEVFLEAYHLAQEAGRSVYYSGARPWVLSRVFCQAPFVAYVATARGELVTCFEMAEPGPASREFVVGHVDESGPQLDQEALARFIENQHQGRDRCRGCFCFWHCCGDCATRSRAAGGPGSARCQVTQDVTRELIVRFIAEGDGVWNGLRNAQTGTCEIGECDAECSGRPVADTLPTDATETSH